MPSALYYEYDYYICNKNEEVMGEIYVKPPFVVKVLSYLFD